MALIHWDPFRSLRPREEFLEEFLRRFEPAVFTREGVGELMEPAIEISETENDVTVKMQVPGVEKDQLEVNVLDRQLTVRGEVKKETEEKKKNYYRQEIRYGSFDRTVTLPAEVDSAKASADLRNGVLKITIPKSPKAKAQKIGVSVH